MVAAERVLVAALVVMSASLLLVGIVSHTPLRHVVQVAPVLVVLGLALARRPGARSAAKAVFVFWLAIMALIWLFLLGIARVVTGRFSSVEVALTIVIGVAAVVGLAAAIRTRCTLRWPARLAVFVAATALQCGAMWLSLQPMFERR